MVKKSKLLAALDAHKGRDYEAEKRKKQLKAGEKASKGKTERKTQRAQEQDATPTSAEPVEKVEEGDSGWEDENSEDEAEVNGGADLPVVGTNGEEDPEAEESEDDEDEQDVALSDLSEDDREDTVPHQRLTINNGPALLASQSRIALLRKHPQKSSAPFHIHNSLVSSLPPVSDAVTDPNDDLIREQEFYKVARAAAVQARSLLKKEDVPFTRPGDYFAEMVKSEGHMEKIHKKQYDEAADRKGREAARKLRDAKKFGKQVQVAKEQERAKQKRETLDKIKDLKRSMCFPPLPSPSSLVPLGTQADFWARTENQPVRSNQGDRRRHVRHRRGLGAHQVAVRARPRQQQQRRRAERQAAEEGLQVRLRRKEALFEERRCRKQRGHAWLQRCEDEGEGGCWRWWWWWREEAAWEESEGCWEMSWCVSEP